VIGQNIRKSGVRMWEIEALHELASFSANTQIWAPISHDSVATWIVLLGACRLYEPCEQSQSQWKCRGPLWPSQHHHPSICHVTQWTWWNLPTIWWLMMMMTTHLTTTMSAVSCKQTFGHVGGITRWMMPISHRYTN